MDIRDVFAAAALSGLIVRENEHGRDTDENLAMRAYFLADAMLAEKSGEAERKRNEAAAEYALYRKNRGQLEDAGWFWDGEDSFYAPWDETKAAGFTLEDALREHEASQQVGHPHYCGPCQRCGHRCPSFECDKCGGDPMQPGDTLCVECDRDDLDKEKAT